MKELLTTYWSQVTLLLLAAAYLVKRTFDNKSKKLEINHSLFQTHRIISVNKFFKCYARVESMWNGLAIWRIIERDISAKEIDNLIFPTLNDLKESVLELKIYFEEKDHQDFQTILDKMLTLNKRLLRLYLDHDPEVTSMQKVSFYDTFKDEILKEVKPLMNSIAGVVRGSYFS